MKRFNLLVLWGTIVAAQFTVIVLCLWMAQYGRPPGAHIGPSSPPYWLFLSPVPVGAYLGVWEARKILRARSYESSKSVANDSWVRAWITSILWAAMGTPIWLIVGYAVLMFSYLDPVWPAFLSVLYFALTSYVGFLYLKYWGDLTLEDG
jgi:hypothetical protein